MLFSTPIPSYIKENQPKPFDYGASPDGEDIAQKLGVLAKPVLLTAAMTSIIDIRLYSHPKGYMQALGRCAHISWPILATTGTFVIVSNLAGSIRRENDRLNWFIGGACSGGVIGLWRRSPMVGFVVGLAFGALGFLKKDRIQNNTFLLYPDELSGRVGGLRSGQYDFTITKERPKNWTTGE